MILAERSDTVYISTTLFKFALVSGATIEAAIFDPSNGQWLANWATGTWQASKATQALTENPESAGRYGANANFTGTASTRFVMFLEVTAGGAGAGQEDIAIVDELYGLAKDLTVAKEATLAGKASQASVDTIDANVDAILVDTGTTIPDAIATVDGNVDAVLVDTGTTLPAQLTALQNHGDANWGAGAVPSVADIVDGIWDEVLAGNHDGAGSAGLALQGASAGGVDLDLLTAKVWNAVVASYQQPGSTGQALSTAAATETIRTLLNSAIRQLRKYGPMVSRSPIVTKDEVHAGDIGTVVTVIINLDGEYADLSTATGIDFEFTDPAGTTTSKAGASVNSGASSYATVTTDATVFDTPGRWRVQATATWPDLTEKQSDVYIVDVDPSLPFGV